MGRFIRTFPKTKGFQKNKKKTEGFVVRKSTEDFLLAGVYRKEVS